MNIAGISIKRPTFIIALVSSMIVVGVIFMNRMSVDMFPSVNFPYISVTTIYPGAGPREMETLVSKILEEQISSISGLKNVSSVNRDGVSFVVGEFTLETDSKYAEQQIRDKIAQIRSRLPKDIQEPIIKKFDPADRPIVTFSLTADLPPAKLYDLADTTIKNGFEQVDNVSSVEILGGTKREIHVLLDHKKLKEYETNITMVAGRIASNSQNVPIGKVSQGKLDLTFRSLGEFRSINQINDVVVSFFASDVPVTVRNIGKVVDTTEEVKTRGFINGKAAMVINVYKQSGANTVDVSDHLLKRMNVLNKTIKKFPGAPGLTMIIDNARPIRMNLDDIKIAIIEGIFLAVLVVYLFLGNFRSTFITVLAIPNSLIGAFIFMGMAGFSINMLSLMALSLAVGLLIDDAIVVRENIFRHIEEGMPPMKAAQVGTDEVRLAVIATTLSVIAVFLPVGFLKGIVGQFFKEFGLTVVFAMAISLFDALTVAPMLSAYFVSKLHTEPKGIFHWLYLPSKWFDKAYTQFERFYENAIRYTLKHKLLILVSSVFVFIASLALVIKVPKTFMPVNESGEFFVNLEAPPGTSLEQMEKYAAGIDDLLRKEKELEMVSYTVGNANGETNKASFFVKMLPYSKRKRSTQDMKVYIRNTLGQYAQILNPSVDDVSLAGEQKPFLMIITGENIDEISSIAGKLKEKFKTIPGLVDLDTSNKPGKPEFQVRFNPEKMIRLGVASIGAGMELRGMVEGITPAKYRENGMEYDIRVKLQEDQRDLSREFDYLYVPNVNMQPVKLKNIAEPAKTEGPSGILRRNRSRYVSIYGNLDKGGAIGDITAQAGKIMAQEKLPEGVGYEFTGQSENFAELVQNMIIAAGLSIIFIYLVLMSLYESLVVPFTIMLALPLAIVGALIALFLTGQSISIFTMIGLIMLLGLVTKNSILLVDYTQKLMREGVTRSEALVKAGLTRLRPILMTTFALIAGMLPLALGLTEVGRFRQSMGIAVIGGLISSTFLSLVVIPAVFGYMDEFRLRSRRLFGRPQLREVDKTE